MRRKRHLPVVVLLSISNNLLKKDQLNWQLLSMSIGDIVHAVLFLLNCLPPTPAMAQCRSMFCQMLQGMMLVCDSLYCPQSCLIQPAYFPSIVPALDWIKQAWQ